MRSKVILLLAIIMGLITTYLFYHYMDGFKKTEESSVEMANAVVAKREIRENERLSSDMVAIVKVPAAGLFKGAFTDPLDVTGKYAVADIAEGEPIMPHRVQSEQEEHLYLTRKIEEQQRAVSVGVNFVQSVSNLIEPDDYVDVIFTKLGKPELGTVTVSTILLKKVKVLAVGRRMIETAEGDEYVEYSSATLELNEQDTVKAVNAANDGILTLTLHSRIVSEDRP